MLLLPLVFPTQGLDVRHGIVMDCARWGFEVTFFEKPV
jgi:hypothetical protein